MQGGPRGLTPGGAATLAQVLPGSQMITVLANITDCRDQTPGASPYGPRVSNVELKLKFRFLLFITLVPKSMPFGEMSTDEVGRCFCEEHMRVKCHESCLDFGMVEVSASMSSEIEKHASQDADMRAVTQAWRNTNPGGSTMNGGASRHSACMMLWPRNRLSAALKTVDKRTCGWCGANSGAVNLKSCTAVKFVTAAKGLPKGCVEGPQRSLQGSPGNIQRQWNEGKEIAADRGHNSRGGRRGKHWRCA